MKKLGLILLLHCVIFCKSQNLVPNGSFENYSNCPWMDGQIYFAIPWQNPSSGGTPDLWNGCSSACNVPLAYAGIQYALTGDGFVGLYTYNIIFQAVNIREYIEVELLDSLKVNSWYCISFYCNLADVSDYGIDKLGAYISDTAIYRNDTSYFPVTPQIENTTGNFLSDKVNWMQVSGLYQAHGGEKFITIGNFRSDTLTDTLAVSGGMYPFAYYFIEDVSVINCDSLMGINEQNNFNFNIYPNPATDFLNIKTKTNKPLTFTIFDLLGQEKLSVAIKGDSKIVVGSLASAVYVYRVYDGEKILRVGKLMKE